MIIDGRKIAEEFQEEVAREVKRLRDDYGIIPGLATISVGEDAASKTYLSMKRRACENIAIHYEEHIFPKGARQGEVIKRILELNDDVRIHGILVQLPLPSHLDEDVILEKVLPKKDVDGFHPLNLGSLLIGNENISPCTPSGIVFMLEKIGVDLRGRHAVVVGRSKIVGRPLAAMLLNRDATVTICHSKTKDLGAYTKQADILVVAAGRAKLITKEMIKEGAVIIDVGMNRIEGKLCGDVDFEDVKEKASAITPVPGGVGPMTVAMLMKNTLVSAKNTLGE
ncbi:MAG: bifunctional methylenetetrahydrofolate dehydrogenase/methenyltetrahydrofolate cyclohydrolase FolD [Methanocellales archaeon]|nr:bifunctional methylenetetrahydrofolate dehydrogenase/methenyltetrahydrofolate cyclohydrolase FolD [Methanocellales archaeon]MDD3420881.1 bifunctional methylenetetrahydrofolate dehydrogenase/methenyltetrahydrofolate cyclohydrolase FolD [Methanocellales archaeon]MDD4898520.1 bifunctional methylenetetrahydrofolate dehydrogenase/methenyltetrahydrofolate cyclohydrolase FolD [Methanocellales archaeon]MDD5446890.1 bifunctional methylenetetrahydrofolate dehydrogenase/methenyltetrahydrofolate cyclohyd